MPIASSRTTCLVAAGLAICLAAAPAGAADPEQSSRAQTLEIAQPAATSATAPAVDLEPWRFNATGYAWLVGMTGSVTARGQTIDTNASFLDLVQKSNTLVGLMGYFEADKGQVGVYVDLVYSKLNFSASQTAYRNPLPALRISASAYAALSYELFIAEVGGVYELAHWTHSETSRTSLDGLLAFRYWNNSIQASFDADVNFDVGRRFRFDRSFGLAVARADAIQWVDPILGFRLKHQFTQHQEMMVRADIGGFGLGSQFTWQAVAVYGYGWQLDGGQKITAMLGFRALGVNYSSGWGDDTVGINEILYGPIVGVSYKF